MLHPEEPLTVPSTLFPPVLNVAVTLLPSATFDQMPFVVKYQPRLHAVPAIEGVAVVTGSAVVTAAAAGAAVVAGAAVEDELVQPQMQAARIRILVHTTGKNFIITLGIVPLINLTI